MTSLSPVSQVAHEVATRRASFDVEALRREAISQAMQHILADEIGRARYVLARATERCARLSEHEPDLVEAWALYCAALDRHVEVWALRSLRRQGGRRG